MKNTVNLNAGDLKTAMAGLNKIIGKRSTLPVLQSVLVKQEGGRASLQATDLDTYTTFSLPQLQEGPSTAFLVPAEALNRIVKGSGNEDAISLVQTGKQSVTIRTFIASKPVDHNIDSIDIKEWTEAPTVTGKPIVLDCEFHETLKTALEFSSEDQTRYILNGVCMDVNESNAHYLVSTNGSVAFAANSYAFDLKKSLILPSRKFLSWNGFWNKDCELSYEPAKKDDNAGWIQLKDERWTFITKEIAGQYPNWKQVVPSESKTRVTLTSDAAKQVIDLCSKLPGNEEPYYTIHLSVLKSKFFVEGCQKGGEKVTSIEVPANVEGDDVRVALNRHYLNKALKLGLFDILMVDPFTPIVFKGDRKKLISALLRPEPSPADQPLSSAPENKQPKPAEAQAEAKTENTEMTKQASRAPAEVQTPESGVRVIVQKIDQIKDTLKGVVR